MKTQLNLKVYLVRLLCVLAIISCLGRPQPVAAGGADVTIKVDSNSEGVSAGSADGLCQVLGGEICTLREAIKEANFYSTQGKTVLIQFVVHDVIINLTLGALIISGDHITVDGETNQIVISGLNNPASTDVFNIQGNYNAIMNLSIYRSRRHGIHIGDPGVGGYGSNNVVSYVSVAGSLQNGVNIYNGSHNQVTGSLIGSTDWANNLCATYQGNGHDGIAVGGVGSANVLSGNRIVCNGYSGTYIYSSSTTYTLVQNCQIGTDGSSYALGNGYAGVKDEQAGYTTLDNNLISRNGWEGVWLQGSTHATLTRNKIGTNASGNVAMSNTFDGVLLSDNAADNTLGSSTNNDLRNVISGNTHSGVSLLNTAHDNLIDGNLIGVGISGAAVPNGLAGVALMGGAYNNDIGSPEALVLQVVAGNAREGVYVENASYNHIHLNNYVGIYEPGFLPRGNGREGILIHNAANNLVEGYYAYNGLAGIAVEGEPAVTNMLVPTQIKDNGGLPIDLGNDGATRNGSHGSDGPNHWLPYPVITGVSGSTVSGTACNGCVLFIYAATGNPGANRGGGVKIGLVFANASGNWSYALPAGKKASDLSLIACTGGLEGECSEMSPRPQVYMPLVKK